MDLSVVILNYKVPAHLLLCVDSVSKAIINLNAEIIVADNNSQDDSLALLDKFFPKVVQVPISENLGFSKGNNIAIQHAKGKYICLLNPDTVVSEDTFIKAISFAQQQKDLGALGVQLVDGCGNFLPESKRNVPTPKIALQKLFGFDKQYYAEHLNRNDIGEVAVLVGAFMLMQKERYLEVGGLDEDYFMYGEDIDLSYQFLKKGYKNYYLGSVNCIHFKGESTTRDAKFRNRFYGAMQLFYQKHFKANWVLEKIVNISLGIAKMLNLGLQIYEVEQHRFKQSYLISDDQNLYHKLSHFQDLKMISINEIENSKGVGVNLVFDGRYISYKNTIKLMHVYSNYRWEFYIISASRSVMINGKSNQDKSEVTYL